jgi:hypothetical protein
MQVTITLTQFFDMGGKIENLKRVKNRYHDEYGPISFSHKNPKSFGNPNGVDMYNVGGKKVAESWVEVIVEMKLDSKYL